MARKKQVKKTNDILEQTVDSLVEEIEQTMELNKIDEEIIEQLEDTVVIDKKEIEAKKTKSKKTSNSNKKKKSTEDKEKSDEKEKSKKNSKNKAEVKDDVQKNKEKNVNDNSEEEELSKEKNKKDESIKDKNIEEDSSDEIEKNEEEIKEEDSSKDIEEIEKIKEESTKEVEAKVEELEEDLLYDQEPTEQLEIVDDEHEITEILDEEELIKSTAEEFEKIEEELAQSIKDDIKEIDEDIQKLKNDFSKTDTYEFKFDDDRLTDKGSLDTSFLEGRIKKVPEIQKTPKKEKKESSINLLIIKKISVFLVTVLLFVVILYLLFVGFSKISFNKTDSSKKDSKNEVVEKEEKLIDDNYLFAGDLLNDSVDLDKYFNNLPVVNSSKKELKSNDLLNNLNNYIYQYNPSKVFIQVGVYDYIEDGDSFNLLRNVESIIKEIKKNRPYAKIYLVSLFPINDSDNEKIDNDLIKDIDNDDISTINNELKKLAEKNKTTYVDLYNVLYSDDDKGLKLDYTNDGLNLSEEGYKIISEKIKKYLDV